MHGDLWRSAPGAFPRPRAATATLLVDGNQVFVTHADTLVAFSLDTGQQLWQRRVERVTSNFPVSVSLAVAGHAQQGDAK